MKTNYDTNEMEEIIYNEYYRYKLVFYYFLFSKEAMGIFVVLYLYGFQIDTWSLNQFLTLTLISLIIGYKFLFTAYKGDEFSIFLIKYFGDLNFAIKKRTKELYA